MIQIIFNTLVLVFCFYKLFINQAKLDKNRQEALYLSSVTKDLPQFDYVNPFFANRKLYSLLFGLAAVNLVLTLIF